MPATADSLRDLHQLHQRAKALRDRLASGPKVLAGRQAALGTRQVDLEQARKALQDAKVQLNKHEHALKGVETKIDDFKVKLNQVKKNDEYKAIQNQIAHDNTTKSKLEEDILQSLEVNESRAMDLRKLEDEVKRFAAEIASMEKQIDEQSVAQKQQLVEIEAAIIEAEALIPTDFRDRYRRIVARYGADALAACEDGACHGCFTSVTTQTLNDLINEDSLSFCISCGRLLYLPEPEIANTRRSAK